MKHLLITLLAIAVTAPLFAQPADQEKINEAGEHMNLAARNFIGGVAITGATAGGAIMMKNHTDVPEALWITTASAGAGIGFVLFVVSTVHFLDAGDALQEARLHQTPSTELRVSDGRNGVGLTLHF